MGRSSFQGCRFSRKGVLFFAMALVSLQSVSMVDGGANASIDANDDPRMAYDAFDDIEDRMKAVDAENCKSKTAAELRLPAETVSQPPKFSHSGKSPVTPGRTKLLHLRNMALNRAFFYSYILQTFHDVEWYFDLPGLLYYYSSVAADISANKKDVVGSGIFFDSYRAYAVWYRFNITLGLFGPRAWWSDDSDMPDYLRPLSSRGYADYTMKILDYGSTYEARYMNKDFKINQWYDLFLPDDWNMQGRDSARKSSYEIGVKYSNETGRFTTDEFQLRSLFGPPSPKKSKAEYLPVLFTEPYFDCGQSNRWIVSAVAPVVDIIPKFQSLGLKVQRKMYTAVTTMDMDFLTIDLNPCPTSRGHYFQNYFQDIAKCKSTTICEPLNEWGFRRGGYQCRCKPGHHYPPSQSGPFQGIEIEGATEAEYKNGFDCIPGGGIPHNSVGRKKRSFEYEKNLTDPEFDFFDRPSVAKKTDRAARTVKEDVLQSRILDKKLRFLRLANLKEEETLARTMGGKERKRRSVVPRVSHALRRDLEADHNGQFSPRSKHSSNHTEAKQQSFDPRHNERMMSILFHKSRINGGNCHGCEPDELQLPRDVGYNVDVQFSNQAKTALRLSHFLCNFLQNIDLQELNGKWSRDRPLNVDKIFGEVLANTMGDLKIKGSGVFFDVDKFNGSDGESRQLFGPYAWRLEKDRGGQDTDEEFASNQFRIIDYAGFSTPYLTEPWFKNVKQHWHSSSTYYYGLTKFKENVEVSSIPYPYLPGYSFSSFYYKAPSEEDGIWTAPYFDCDGYVDDWIITYSVPFFGLNSDLSATEFQGVVIVDVKLDELDINQCPQDFAVQNAFKDTAKCHYKTTECIPLASKKFVLGSYKCQCKIGFEYPFNNSALYFDGKTVEEEYRLKADGDKQASQRYNDLQCWKPMSTSMSTNHASWTEVHSLVLLTILVFWSYQHDPINMI